MVVWNVFDGWVDEVEVEVWNVFDGGWRRKCEILG